MSSVIGNAAYDFLKVLVKKMLGLLSKNNKQKGNAWGAKIELKQLLKSNEEQSWHFFLDGIPESKLFEAISSIQSRIDDFNRVLGEEYLGQVKHLGFSYDNDNWKMIGVEKFKGETEVPATHRGETPSGTRT